VQTHAGSEVLGDGGLIKAANAAEGFGAEDNISATAECGTGVPPIVIPLLKSLLLSK